MTMPTKTTKEIKEAFYKEMKNANKNIYSVYVIRLKEAMLDDERYNKKFIKRNPHYKEGMRFFYVGQTSKTPEERFKIHKSGHMHGSPWVRDYGSRLYKSMYRKYNPLMTQDVAKLVEEYVAKKLQEEGHGVWWN
jgi:hypothetical protein